MKDGRFKLILILSVIFLSGCYTTGLSLRENRSHNLSRYIYSLYNGGTQSKQKTHYIRKPIKLAVAQLGEIAPTEEVIKRLVQHKSLFYSVTTIPAGELDIYSPYQRDKDSEQTDMAQRMKRMRYLAKDQGADYLFIFGGTADFQMTPNVLQFFDLTLIGAYILPSTHHEAQGRASGALIDVHGGRVIFMPSASASVSKTTPSYLNYYERNNAVYNELKEAVIGDLICDFIEKLRTFNR
jgi:hypothetical protein